MTLERKIFYFIAKGLENINDITQINKDAKDDTNWGKEIYLGKLYILKFLHGKDHKEGKVSVKVNRIYDNGELKETIYNLKNIITKEEEIRVHNNQLGLPDMLINN